MQFFSLEEALEQAQNVSSLQLRNQGLTTVPSIIWRAFPNIEVLDLSHNLIKSLPNSISKLPSLRRLIVSNNRITRLPESLEQLSHLKFLDIDQNRIRALQYLPTFLNTLHASNNKLKDASSILLQCSELIHLDLSYNKIEVFPDISTSLPVLQYLNLSHCQLKEIGQLPPQLYALLLAKNRLSALNENWQQLKQLQRFNIASNPIQIELDEGHQLQKVAYLDIRKTKTKWTGVDYLLDQFPVLEYSFGGFSVSQQNQLDSILKILKHKPSELSNTEVYQILKGNLDEKITLDTLGLCLQNSVHPDLKIAAFRALMARCFYKLGRSIKGMRFGLVGTPVIEQGTLCSRLNEQGALWTENRNEANVLIIGHDNWRKPSFERKQKMISENQLVNWLDKKEGRYLSSMKNKLKIDNILRMIDSQDEATFNLVVS